MLAGQFDCSPAALRSAAAGLASRGAAVEAHPVLGLRLIEVAEAPLAEEIDHDLGTRFVGRLAFVHDLLGSTNDEAARLAAGGAPEGTLVVADRQRAGRGRRGRSWTSAGGVGLWCSLLLSPPTPAGPGFLTQLLGAALARAIRGATGVPVLLAWPNDLVVSAPGRGLRKLGGILCEVPRGAARPGLLVAGFGVDVNHAGFPPPLRAVATSLRLERGRTVHRCALLKDMLREIERDWVAAAGGGESLVLGQVRRLSATLGRRVRLRLEGRLLEGTAADLADDGALIVTADDGSSHAVRSGDVEAADLADVAPVP